MTKTKSSRCKKGTRKNRKTGVCEPNASKNKTTKPNKNSKNKKCETYKLTEYEIDTLLKNHLSDSIDSEERALIKNQLKKFKYDKDYISEYYDKTGNCDNQFGDVFYQAASKIDERNKGYIKSNSI